MQQKIHTETLPTDFNHAFTTGMLTGPGFGLCTLVAHSSGRIMGSSIRSYLWLCCGVFHQIPTLAGVLTPSGEGYEGSEGMMLCLFVSVCLFWTSLYICSVSMQTAMGTCLFTVCVVLLCISVVILASVLLPALKILTCPIHTYIHTFGTLPSLLCILILK